MAPKIFMTGVTGFIGGDVFSQLYEAHPEYDYVLLVRNEERAKPVKARYPKAQVVLGTLDDASLLEKQAAEADLVVHTADSADSEPSAKAIAKGIVSGHSPDRPGRYIHLSGTAILQWFDQENKRYGEAPAPGQKYSDIADVDRIVSLPDHADHRTIDKIVQAVNKSDGVRTAIIAPPTIYGTGRGPGNTKSIQVNAMARFVLQNGYAPIVGPGKAVWDNVHIHDLSPLFVRLVEAALDPAKRDDPDLFGSKAYFFAENGNPHSWREVAEQLAEAVHRQGFMAEPKTEWVDKAGAEKNQSVLMWAFNSQSVADRARKFLGWTTRGPSLKDEISQVVALEAKGLGVKPTVPSQ